MSEIENWDCHVYFSTLRSEHHVVRTRLKLKIQERTFTKSGGGSSDKCSGSAGTKFSSRSADIIFDWIKPLEWRLAQLMSVWKHCGFMTSETGIWAQLWKRSFSTIIDRGSPILKKHLLRKTQLFLTTMYIVLRLDLCSCVRWCWNFSTYESHSRPSTIQSILSVFDRRFRISLKPLSFWSPKNAAIKTVQFWWAIFSQNYAKWSISWLSSTPTAFPS